MFGRLAPRKVRPGSAKAPLHKRNISRRAQRLDRTKEAASEEEVAAVQLEDVELHEEASKSYLSYALSVSSYRRCIELFASPFLGCKQLDGMEEP